jgi:hypothetical protein
MCVYACVGVSVCCQEEVEESPAKTEPTEEEEEEEEVCMVVLSCVWHGRLVDDRTVEPVDDDVSCRVYLAGGGGGRGGG